MPDWNVPKWRRAGEYTGTCQLNSWSLRTCCMDCSCCTSVALIPVSSGIVKNLLRKRSLQSTSDLLHVTTSAHFYMVVVCCWLTYSNAAMICQSAGGTPTFPSCISNSEGYTKCCFLFYKKVRFKNVAYFSKLGYLTSFQDPNLSFAVTSQVRVSAICYHCWFKSSIYDAGFGLVSSGIIFVQSFVKVVQIVFRV